MQHSSYSWTNRAYVCISVCLSVVLCFVFNVAWGRNLRIIPCQNITLAMVCSCWLHRWTISLALDEQDVRLYSCVLDRGAVVRVHCCVRSESPYHPLPKYYTGDGVFMLVTSINDLVGPGRPESTFVLLCVWLWSYYWGSVQDGFIISSPLPVAIHHHGDDRLAFTFAASMGRSRLPWLIGCTFAFLRLTLVLIRFNLVCGHDLTIILCQKMQQCRRRAFILIYSMNISLTLDVQDKSSFVRLHFCAWLRSCDAMWCHNLTFILCQNILRWRRLAYVHVACIDGTILWIRTNRRYINMPVVGVYGAIRVRCSVRP